MDGFELYALWRTVMQIGEEPIPDPLNSRRSAPCVDELLAPSAEIQGPAQGKGVIGTLGKLARRLAGTCVRLASATCRRGS